ncbi:MAG: hypothetical protein K0S41_2530 [Anaerocolumna sp.]|jgi:hypothetical protein|nr:hypothetical protein [Anaerocolumna sp.]
METLKIIVFEYLLGYCLQSFAIVLGIYALNRQKILVKDFMLASILLMIISIFVRLLPISFGVHIIINMLFLYLICVIPLKMPAYKTIRSASVCFVLILISEMIVTSFIMLFIGNERLESILKDSLQKSYLGVLANVIFTLLVTLAYFIFMKKGDNNRNISSQNS